MERRIIFRLPDLLFEQISEAIEYGTAKNTSELVRAALKEFFQKKEAAKL